MQKNNIKRIALILALMKLLSTVGEVKAEETTYNIEGTLITAEDVQELKSYIYSTFELESAPIYDEENILSGQYGGDQRVFKENFKNLINEPLIWKEMQRHFPVSRFDSEEAAMDFYEVYFRLITDFGCGYVAATNRIFQAFEDRPKDFERIFGYPMYVIREDGSIDYNFEVFTVAFFNFSVLYPNYSENKKEMIKDSLAKTLAELRFLKYSTSEEYLKTRRVDHRPTPEELEDLFKKNRAAERKYEKLLEAYSNAKDDPIDFTLELTEKFGYLKEFLKTYGVKISVKYYPYVFGKYQKGDIIASKDYKLYKMDYSGTVSKSDGNGGEHYMCFVGYDEYGNVLVSSGGERYILDTSNATYTRKVVIKIKK